MHEAYSTIFTRLAPDFRAVEATLIGGNHSHEFHVLAESGEDAIAFSTVAITRPTWSWPQRSRRRVKFMVMKLPRSKNLQRPV